MTPDQISKAVRCNCPDCVEYRGSAEARLDEPLTRSDLLVAIESVASGYSNHHADLRDAFRALAKALS